MIDRLRPAGALVAFVLLVVSLRAQQTPPAGAPLTAVIPADPQISIGQLPNGLRYYVRANAEPKNRAELRLVVNAGSVLEEEDQRGLAHFVEHMAFNGTRHFPKQDIVSFMESNGMRFGSDLNAYTSFDETVYQLEVPTDKPEVLDRAMLILEDWTHDVTFDPAEIDKERGVIMEEWRLGRGAGARMQDKQLPILLQGSRYADRIPIGKPEIIQNFKPERLKQFYADWYRPDLMAVIAVGDFDKAAVEALVKNHFSSIPRPAAAKARPVFTVPAHPGTSYTIATDPEATSSRVSVYHLQPSPDQTTIGAYRQNIVQALFAGMLSSRFSEMAQKPDAPFLGAGAQRGDIVRTAEASMLSAAVKDDGIARGLGALFTEAQRVTQFGFTAPEFDRIKTNMLRGMERAIAEKDKQDSGDLAAELARNFLTREPIPGIVYESDLYKRFIPEITLAEVNALAASWSPDGSRVVEVNAPEKPGIKVPSETELTAVMSGAGGALTAYVDNGSSQPLLDAVPAPGSITNTATNDAYGITTWTLSNGVKVLLKPTTFKQDEVLFRAFSLGGTSLASDADFVAATTAAQVVAAGGLGTFDAVTLPKMLAGKAASVVPSISEVDQSLNGGGSPKDLETLFQLIYLRFTQPRPDPTIFQVMTDRTKTQLANQTASPAFAFNQALSAAIYGDHLRARLMTPAMVDEMSLEKSMAFYKERFADASGFTFVFVGSFDLPTLRPLVERYLASLPATHKQETWKDVNMRPAKGVVERRVAKGIEPKAQTTVFFSGPFQYDQKHRVAIRALALVLEARLRETLREDLSGTYGVTVSPSYSKFPVQEYRLNVSFGSSPERADALVANMLGELEKLQSSGPSETLLNDAKQIMLRGYETSSQQNAFYRDEIAARTENGEDLKDLFGLVDFYRNLTAADVQAAAREYLNLKNYVKVTLVPEK